MDKVERYGNAMNIAFVPLNDSTRRDACRPNDRVNSDAEFRFP
jgi:hypothetical protein